MPTGNRTILKFEGEHKPTGARVSMEIVMDGSEVKTLTPECPLCGRDLGFVMHCRASVGDSCFRSAAQCAGCKSWFEDVGIPGHESHKPLTMTFE